MKALTKEEFFNLPTNRNTVKLLQSIVSKQLQNKDLSKSVLWFYASAATELSEYLNSRKSIKCLMEKPTTEKYYNEVLRLKSLGYAKTEILPF